MNRLIKIQPLKKQELYRFIADPDIAREVEKKEEPVRKLEQEIFYNCFKKDPLIEIEISLRRCERVGFFRQ